MVDEPPSTKEIIIQEAAQKFGPELFETVPTSQIIDEPLPVTSADWPGVPPCFTPEYNPLADMPSSPDSIMVGNMTEVPRWRPGSVLKYSAWKLGYDTLEDAEHAALHLRMAADAWNAANVGVTFEYVDQLPDANFVICHKPARISVDNELAKAFFPSDKRRFDYIYVSSLAFQKQWRPHLYKILTHELGHVLGLRHEYVKTRQERAKPHVGESKEEVCVQIGEKNWRSVMNYSTQAPELQPSDISSTKTFYQMENGEYIDYARIVDYDPI